ncbi:MAG TPA: hypothetical protein VHM66_13720 [Solirubrobacterales bacterium]|nr:hypothetical protein [Solirubrobacterales bacterium]
MRKRGVLRALGEELSEARARADANTARRLRRINAVSATSFVIGGSLFAIGAALAQADVGAPLLPASVFLAGGAFFSTGAYTALLQVINGPRERSDGSFAAAPWRWWASEPGRLEWLSALVLFAGTLVFAINLVDSFIPELTPARADRLIWSPDMIGCALFLVSGHLAMVEISGSWLPCWRPRELGWRIVAVNQLGSVLFMVAAVASFVHTDGDLLAVGVANWSTLTGGLCFAIAGAMQEFERPQQA